MNVQVPIEPVEPQVLQDSVHAALQHRPSTQKLLEQSEAQVQPWPLGFFVSASLLQLASSAAPSCAASRTSPAPAAPSCGPSHASSFLRTPGRALLPQPAPSAVTRRAA